MCVCARLHLFFFLFFFFCEKQELIPKTVGLPTPTVHCSSAPLKGLQEALDELFGNVDVVNVGTDRRVKSKAKPAFVRAMMAKDSSPRALASPSANAPAYNIGPHVLEQTDLLVDKDACLAHLDSTDQSLTLPLSNLLTDAGAGQLLKHPNTTDVNAQYLERAVCTAVQWLSPQFGSHQRESRRTAVVKMWQSADTTHSLLLFTITKIT